jgi:hypothetical protein
VCFDGLVLFDAHGNILFNIVTYIVIYYNVVFVNRC